MLNWIELGEKAIFGPNLVEEAEATICRIQDNLNAAMSHQEAYANKRHWPLELEVGDHVYLCASPMKGMKRFGMKGSYPKHPIKILDQKNRVTRRKTIKFFKIQWNSHTEEEATWECEDFLHSHHPDFILP
jgi:hypothetical protein